MKIDQTDTAIDSYHFHVIPYIAQPQEQALLNLMIDGNDYTILELAYLTGLDKSSISARRNKMLKRGLLERGADRPSIIGGNPRKCETVRKP